MTDEKFLERATPILLLEDSSEPKYYTLEEYKNLTAANQKNKDGKWVVLYTTNPIQQDSYVKQARAKGYVVVKLEGLVDAAFIQQMEMKWSDVHFTRVDSEIADNLIDQQEAQDSVLNKDEESKLKELFGLQVPDQHTTVEVKGLSADAPPVLATRPEFMRRMKDMAAMSGPMGSFYANMPDEVTLTVNGNHPIYRQILGDDDKQKQEKVVRNLADLALLSQGLLKGNDLTAFINRSVELMEGPKRPKIIVTE
jgi:molecular chaperone HtpG